MRAIFGKALFVWLAIIPIAIANGWLRQAVLVPKLGSAWGLALSGLVLSLGIFVAAWLAAPWYGERARRLGFAIGVFWLVLTLGFEVGITLGAPDRGWQDVVRALNPATGNLWLLVLATTLLAPVIAARRSRPGSLPQARRRE